MVWHEGHYISIYFRLGPLGPWCEHLGSIIISLDQWDCPILSFFGRRPQCKPMQYTLKFGSIPTNLGVQNTPSISLLLDYKINTQACRLISQTRRRIFSSGDRQYYFIIYIYIIWGGT